MVAVFALALSGFQWGLTPGPICYGLAVILDLRLTSSREWFFLCKDLRPSSLTDFSKELFERIVT